MKEISTNRLGWWSIDMVLVGVFSMLIGVYILMMMTVYTEKAILFDLYIPSKYGGDSIYVSESEFITTHVIAAAVSASIAAVIIICMRMQKIRLTEILATSLLSLCGIYTALFLGNAFYSLWGGTWSTVGVVALFAACIVLQLCVIRTAHLRRR